MVRLWVGFLLLSHLLGMAAAGAGEVSADPAGAIYQEELNLTGNEPGGIVDYDLLQKTYQKIDEHALDAPAEAEESLNSLARYLAGPAKNDEERARGVYRWIAANVEYDLEGSRAAARKLRTPEEVLAERKGVCSEYSALFSRLCDLSGLEAVVIRGRGKGYGYSVGSKIPEDGEFGSYLPVI